MRSLALSLSPYLSFREIFPCVSSTLVLENPSGPIRLLAAPFLPLYSRVAAAHKSEANLRVVTLHYFPVLSRWSRKIGPLSCLPAMQSLGTEMDAATNGFFFFGDHTCAASFVRIVNQVLWEDAPADLALKVFGIQLLSFGNANSFTMKRRLWFDDSLPCGFFWKLP